MKKYTFSQNDKVFFVTNAETDDEALENARAENAFDGVQTEAENRYFNVPAITVRVEEIEPIVVEEKEEKEECKEEIKTH